MEVRMSEERTSSQKVDWSIACLLSSSQRATIREELEVWEYMLHSCAGHELSVVVGSREQPAVDCGGRDQNGLHSANLRQAKRRSQRETTFITHTRSNGDRVRRRARRRHRRVRVPPTGASSPGYGDHIHVINM
jgi:hypothetical protein